jgi:tape measure domain-containing protein
MAAQDAELKLKVSLDLAFFRQQLNGLGQAAAGYKIPVQVQFDRLSVQKELNKLGDNFRRRTYRLEVATNIKAEIENAETLARKLRELSGKLKTGGGGSFAQGQQGAAGLIEYMRSQGLSGAGGFVGVGRSARVKAALEELTVKQLRGLAKSEGISGVSRLNRSPLIERLLNDLSQTAMENILGNAQMALRRPVRGIFPSGRTLAQGPLGQYQMGASARQGPTLPTRPIFSASAATAAGGAQRFSFTGMGSMGQFPMSGMMGPSSPLSINARSSMFAGGGGGGGGGGGFRGAMGFGPTPQPINLDVFRQARLPLAGAIGEVASEFANATKQVLLFGTAYKGLAFFLDLPNQAFQATKALATYKNQLQAVTSESGTFEQSFSFVDTLATRFNVPLDSARQGFVKLYASMQPAGFDQGQIEGLFTGIAKAAAAFGLSADKVDRVNYAFAQMASKGQIMSEELKGQLGDVLPGALGLFAQAAQMSIPEFSKAMEDGAFKGKAMEQVLGNVAILLNDKFSAAAMGAANTLQGAVNQIQNNLKLMYESMGPIVDQFAAAFGPQVNSLITDVASAMNALTASVYPGSDVISTMTPRAASLFLTLQELGNSAQNAGRNILSFASSLQIFIAPLVTATKAALDFISIPFVARVGLYAAILASLNGAFLLLARTGIIQATVAMIQFAASFNIAQIGVYIAGIRTVIAVLASMVTTANLARLAVMALKVSLVTLGVGAVLIALDAVAQRLLNIDNAAQAGRKSVKEFAQELDKIAASGDVESATRQYLDANTKLAQAQAANQKALRDLAAARELPAVGGRLQVIANAQQKVSDTYGQVLAARREVEQARKTRDSAVRQQQQQNQRTQQQLQEVDLSEGDGKGKTEKGRVSLDRLVNAQFARNAALLKSEAAVAREETAALAPDTAQAERMLQYYTQFREQLIDMATIQAQIKDAEKNRSAYLKDGMSASQLDYNIGQLKNELQVRALDLLALEQKYRNQARKDNEKDAEEQKKKLQERINKQREINRLLEDARIQAGLISPAEAARIQQRRQFEDAQTRFAEAGRDPSELATIQAAVPVPGSLEEAMSKVKGELEDLTKLNEIVKNSAKGIGEAFGNSFKEIVNGSMTAQEALASFFQNVGDYFLDMAARMIAKWTEMQIIGLAQSLLSGMSGAGGGSSIVQGVDVPIAQMPAGMAFANGGIARGGFVPFKAFADGGAVQGPTLGLVGEGRYNEAIVPLPNGKSIPVDLGGAAGNQIVSNITVNVNNGQAQTEGSSGAGLSRKLEGAVKQVIIGEMRPGGVLSGRR